jgi:hypothetical protein
MLLKLIRDRVAKHIGLDTPREELSTQPQDNPYNNSLDDLIDMLPAVVQDSSEALELEEPLTEQQDQLVTSPTSSVASKNTEHTLVSLNYHSMLQR